MFFGKISSEIEQPVQLSRRVPVMHGGNAPAAALWRDRARAAAPVSRLSGGNISAHAGGLHCQTFDREAIERAENEGMPARPA